MTNEIGLTEPEAIALALIGLIAYSWAIYTFTAWVVKK